MLPLAVPGATGAAENYGLAPDRACASDTKPVVDACGTTVDVSKGCVTLKYEKIEGGPNDGKKCISKVTVGSDDEATITVPPGVTGEVKVTGDGKVTVDASDQGTKDGEHPEDSEPGIVISGAGSVAQGGTMNSQVKVLGSGNVVQLQGSNHHLTVTGDHNVVLTSGTNNPVSTNGNDNTVY